MIVRYEGESLLFFRCSLKAVGYSCRGGHDRPSPVPDAVAGVAFVVKKRRTVSTRCCFAFAGTASPSGGHDRSYTPAIRFIGKRRAGGRLPSLRPKTSKNVDIQRISRRSAQRQTRLIAAGSFRRNTNCRIRIPFSSPPERKADSACRFHLRRCNTGPSSRSR